MHQRLVGLTLGIAVIVGSWSTLGSAAGGPPPSVPPEDAQAIEAAVRAYSIAFLGNDAATAYESLVTRCQKRLKRSKFRQLVRTASRKYGDAELVSFEIVKFSGERARVAYRYDERALNVRREPWVHRNGVWLRKC